MLIRINNLHLIQPLGIIPHMADPIAQELGQRGGLKTKEKYGTEYFKRISQLAAEARTRKKKLKEKTAKIRG